MNSRHAVLETEFLERGRFMAVLPEGHRLVEREYVSVSDLCSDPFLMLKKGENVEVSEIFEREGVTPQFRFTTWDDYAIMSMVEGGLGISILPKLILRRVPYRVVLKELDTPAYRNIGLAMRSKKTASLAALKFLDYLKYR